jgi:hypothetical protein
MHVRIPGRRKLLLGLGTAALVGAALVGTAGSGSAAPAAGTVSGACARSPAAAAVRTAGP